MKFSLAIASAILAGTAFAAPPVRTTGTGTHPAPTHAPLPSCKAPPPGFEYKCAPRAHQFMERAPAPSGRPHPSGAPHPSGRPHPKPVCTTVVQPKPPRPTGGAQKPQTKTCYQVTKHSGAHPGPTAHPTKPVPRDVEVEERDAAYEWPEVKRAPEPQDEE